MQFPNNTVNLLPSADKIIALDKGTILEQGTFGELKAARGYVYSFCLQYVNDKTSEGGTEETVSRNTYKPAAEKGRITEAGTPTGKARQVRDFSVYIYYVQTIGWGYTCIFLVLEAFWAFFTTFPSKRVCLFHILWANDR